MSKHRKGRPAVDPAVARALALTRDGQAMSHNRAPAPDLAPWIARLYVTRVELPENYALRCGLFSDTPFIRVQLAGDWRADTADGVRTFGRKALFFGPHSRIMPLSVRGSFASVGVGIRPGACTALGGPQVGAYLDRIAPVESVSPMDSPALLEWFRSDVEPEGWLESLEALLRAAVTRRGAAEPDPVAARFEWLAFADPSISVAQAARECGVERRRLERVVNRDFGMPPKQVLRRARALDMASNLRGVADGAEAEEMALRYYDDSHLIREFTELFGMAPRQFVDTPQPLITLALEARQARRLEMLNRIEPGTARPWQ